MTDEPTNEIIEVSAHTGPRINLSFYSSIKNGAKDLEFQKLQAEIEGKLARNEPVFIYFTNDDRRLNSVGRIKSLTFSRQEQRRRSYYSTDTEVHVYMGIEDMVVVWDGRSNKVKPRPGEIQYLPDWTHGTQWVWDQPVREKEEPIIAYDHLGQQLEVGQNVCFVHRQYGLTSMKFGTVTRFTAKGSVFVKTMKLRDGVRAGEELKAHSMEDVIIINDALMKRILMAKLAAN